MGQIEIEGMATVGGGVKITLQFRLPRDGPGIKTGEKGFNDI